MRRTFSSPSPILAAVFVSVFSVVAFFARDALAMGSFHVRHATANESNGSWKVAVAIDIGRAPATPHVPMKFFFTRTVAYELSLVDGSSTPVETRTNLTGQPPMVASLDVDFSDGSGKIYKGTNFDFSVSREQGYLPGEYAVRVRLSDGTDVGVPGRISFLRTTDTNDTNYKNDIVDRRTITFNAGKSGNGKIKKVDNGIDGGVTKDTASDENSAGGNGDVTPSGTAAPFIPADAYNKTPEEQGLKDHPKGCGCSVPGSATPGGTRLFAGALAFGLAIVFGARRRGRKSFSSGSDRR